MSRVTQSAVSQQISKLEDELSMELIRRSGGLTVATDAGMAFYNAAKDILLRYEGMLAEIRSAADEVHGTLRVGTIYSVGFYLLDPYIREFMQAHPEVNLHVEYTHWHRINAAVLNNEMDLGIVAFPETHRSIEIIPFINEEMVLVCAPQHRLAAKDTVDPSEISGEDFVAFSESIPTRQYIDRVLKSHKISINIKMEFDNIELLKRSVEINSGISILPKENVQHEVANGRMSAASFSSEKKWVRELGIIRNRTKAPSPAEKLFVRMLRTKPT